MVAPKLRFPEFNEKWEIKKLADIANITMGQSPKGESYTTNPNDTILIQGNADIINEKVVPRIYTNSPTKFCDIGDVILSVRAPVGEIGISQYKACLGRGVCSINSKNHYIYHLLSKFRDTGFWKSRSQGSTFESINGDDIKGVLIHVPSVSEQNKISTFFDTINKKIQLQQERVDLLKEQKKGFMQKIFSQELRFKDEDGQDFPQWKKLKLSDFAERVTRKNSNLQTNKPLTISAQYGLIDQIEFFNKNVASENLTGYYLLENGEFAYNKSYSNGFPLGTIKRLDRYENGALSTLYICFKLNEKVDSDFLVHYFDSSSWHKEVSLICVEGARNHGLLNVSVSEFFDTEHFIPSYKEQIKIAEFLNVVNTNIKLNEQKLDKLQQQKQAFMQQMFI